MPNLVICQNGESKLLAQCKSYLETCKIRIFVNNHTPLHTDTTGAYQNAAGIADQMATWGTISINADGKAQMDLTANIVFQQSGAIVQTAYGIFVVEPVGQTLICAALFSSPINLVANGDAVQVTVFSVTLADFCT